MCCCSTDIHSFILVIHMYGCEYGVVCMLLPLLAREHCQSVVLTKPEDRNNTLQKHMLFVRTCTMTTERTNKKILFYGHFAGFAYTMYVCAILCASFAHVFFCVCATFLIECQVKLA